MARFDLVSKVYDLLPIPNHPRVLRARLVGVHGPRLDIGGGTGRTTALVHDGADQVVVVDPSRGMLRQGLRVGRTHAAVLGVGESLPLARASVAAVTATEAFHHFAPHERAVLAEAARVLRDDGVLLVEEIDPTRFTGRLIAGFERVMRFGSHFRTPQKMEALVGEAFADVLTERTGPFTYLVEARAPRRGADGR